MNMINSQDTFQFFVVKNSGLFPDCVSNCVKQFPKPSILESTGRNGMQGKFEVGERSPKKCVGKLIWQDTIVMHPCDQI